MVKKKKQTRILVQSKSTGLTFDGHMDSFEALSDHFQNKWQTQQLSDLQHSLSVYNVIQTTNFKVYRKTIKGNLYRLTFGGCSPFDIAGNLADGGRFNIGGAQGAIAQKYFNLSKAACIYTASSLTCARAEVQFHKHADKFILTPKKPLKLIDLEKTIINFPNYNGLKTDIDQSPLSAKWSMQSVPLVSQLFVTYLRNNFEFDGVVYPSTKYPRGKNIVIFIPQGKTGANFFKQRKNK